MQTVRRDEIVDYITYSEIREPFQKKVFAEKARRRIHVGEFFTFLFENALTIRYQIQEMMRAEKIVREKDILHELETYNSILGSDGELGCSLMIEIDDPEKRNIKLREWITLPRHIYADSQDGIKAYALFDGAQIGEDRLSSVQYLKFPVNGKVPLAIGIDLPGCEAKTYLTEDQRSALQKDLQK
jgi:hypothetical protein